MKKIKEKPVTQQRLREMAREVIARELLDPITQISIMHTRPSSLALQVLNLPINQQDE